MMRRWGEAAPPPLRSAPVQQRQRGVRVEGGHGRGGGRVLVRHQALAPRRRPARRGAASPADGSGVPVRRVRVQRRRRRRAARRRRRPGGAAGDERRARRQRGQGHIGCSARPARCCSLPLPGAGRVRAAPAFAAPVAASNLRHCPGLCALQPRRRAGARGEVESRQPGFLSEPRPAAPPRPRFRRRARANGRCCPAFQVGGAGGGRGARERPQTRGSLLVRFPFHPSPFLRSPLSCRPRSCCWQRWPPAAGQRRLPWRERLRRVLLLRGKRRRRTTAHGRPPIAHRSPTAVASPSSAGDRRAVVARVALRRR